MGTKSNSSAVAAGQLRSLAERIERLEEDKADILEGIEEVYGEAKAHGFCTKTLRRLIAMRKQSSDERDEQAAMLELYMSALGMLAGTPLWEAAFKREVWDRLRKAVKAFGDPGPLTDEEKAQGCLAAWLMPDGTRVSIATAH